MALWFPRSSHYHANAANPNHPHKEKDRKFARSAQCQKATEELRNRLTEVLFWGSPISIKRWGCWFWTQVPEIWALEQNFPSQDWCVIACASPCYNKWNGNYRTPGRDLITLVFQVKHSDTSGYVGGFLYERFNKLWICCKTSATPSNRQLIVESARRTFAVHVFLSQVGSM